MTETPSDVFYRTPFQIRRARYALPLGSPALALTPGAGAGRAWRAARDGRRPEVARAPETPCRAALPDEVPIGAQRLAEAAAACGWAGRVTYARGSPIDKRGKPLKGVVDSVAVRLWHSASAWRAAGVWEAGKTKGAWLWLPGSVGRYAWPRDVGVTVVKEWIRRRDGATIDDVMAMLDERNKRGSTALADDR